MGLTQNDRHAGADAALKARLTERLHGAVASGDAASIPALLAQGADANGVRGTGADYAGCTPLDVAAHRGDAEACRLLLDGGADPRLEDHLPLVPAAGGGHEGTCRLLLERGADVNAAAGPGFTALMAAVEAGKAPVVRLLLSAGADPDTSRPASGAGVRGRRETCLVVAAEAGHADVCRLLVGAGAGTGGRGPLGRTALHLAVGGGHVEACRVLLEGGADPNAADDYGDVPLLLAVGAGSEDLCLLLLKSGADVHARSREGLTAAMVAEECGSPGVQLLILGAIELGGDGVGGGGVGSVAGDGQAAPDGPPLASPCPRCTAPLPVGAAFCHKCGSTAPTYSAARPSPAPRSGPAPSPGPGGVRPPALDPGGLRIAGGLSHAGYSGVFARFEAAGGKWVPTFSLPAFLLGPLWYLFKGMWLKGLVLGAVGLFLIGVTGGLAVFVPWLYYGLFGNWDLYLWERQGKPWW